MAVALVVVQPFASYEKGDRITDPKIVADALEHHHHRVIKIAVAADPAPEPAPAPAPKA